ncbi:PEP-CTERM sorting domain-containing protein [Coraliomargarita sp. SDUM461003]|uniref:PEP-CTERM sorting domain-containing protein n=1 Tax=Thalassobacterium maritimum TaxID=3041265 RepID=A0ABU1ATC1_9BACT|nr:PEP-CTERM sorting domain-containing protein [Coraliomargarita sp. SDUM461003]MDQ8207303.1 PEP-CTERM sorting domain-containing protein [Coraliomargarita sp. SDUM461003]
MKLPQKPDFELTSSAPISYAIKCSALAMAACGLAAPMLNAADVTQVRSVSQGDHWNEANTDGGAIWSDGNAASAANDYFVSGFTLRTTTSSSTFSGNSLTLQSGGSLLLKPGEANRIYTINNLILDGGTINHGQPSNSNTFIAGAITLLSDSLYTATGSSYRNATISASVSGSSVFNVNLGTSDDLTISSASNSFSGEWRVTQSDSGSVSDFFATGNGALGNADVTIGSGIKFDVDYDIASSTKTLALDGIMILDQNHTFGIVQIDGDTLAAGTYSFADLNTAYDAFFEDGGTGSITVVPEPSVYALLSGLLVFAWIAVRRSVSE